MSGEVARLHPEHEAGPSETPYERRLGQLLESVASGATSPEEARRALRDLPFADLGFAKVDHHRELRQGACEIVFAQGKTTEQVVAIVERLLSGDGEPGLGSPVAPAMALA